MYAMSSAVRTYRGQTREQVQEHRAAVLDVREAQKRALGAQEYVAACARAEPQQVARIVVIPQVDGVPAFCLLYTSDAADE